MIEIIGIASIALGIAVLFFIGKRLPERRSSLQLRPPPLPPPEQQQTSVLYQIERHARETAQRDEKRRRWLRPVGVFGRLATYAVLFLTLYAYWPEDISHKQFATLTLSDVAGTAAAIAFALLLIRALFEPDEDEGTKDAWGVIGILILGGAVIGALLLYSR